MQKTTGWSAGLGSSWRPTSNGACAVLCCQSSPTAARSLPAASLASAVWWQTWRLRKARKPSNKHSWKPSSPPLSPRQVCEQEGFERLPAAAPRSQCVADHSDGGLGCQRYKPGDQTPFNFGRPVLRSWICGDYVSAMGIWESSVLLLWDYKVAIYGKTGRKLNFA